jgi:aminoglycoside phosphotransferase (APT) family kinase protein
MAPADFSFGARPTPGKQVSEAELIEALRAMGLLAPGQPPRFTPLSGGVSSDVWRVDLGSESICIKRALPKLRVDQEWFVPVERWQYECHWLRVAGEIVPNAVPALRGCDPLRGLFAMAYLDPAAYRLWKAELRDGRADPVFAAAVGRTLAAIHAATADRPDIAAQFPSDDIFYDIRLDPYLGATARRHPDLAAPLRSLIKTTASTKRALVHGDVSPKNILVGPRGLVFLDAECAWYGDPAFDLAFCLNHLLLKCLWTPAAALGFLACFAALRVAYLAAMPRDLRDAIEQRAASLLPALLLARIDGKSPVEYITAERDKKRVRRTARPLILSPPIRLEQVQTAWARELRLA